MADKFFKGFSTIGVERSRSWLLTDIELIKRDLYNHFYTRMGERVMRPDFGCKIWDYLMDQPTPKVRQDIINEVLRVCAADTRVENLNTLIIDLPKGIRIEITLNYIGMNVIDTFFMDFQAQQSEMYADSLQF